MSFADSVSRDYLVTDDTEAGTYTSVRAGGNVSATVTNADGHEFTARELAQLGGLFQAGDKRWFLGADQLKAAGIAPQPGDLWTDAAGTAWTVTGQCTLDDLGISWECPMTKAR